jgi:hypothetical protein
VTCDAQYHPRDTAIKLQIQKITDTELRTNAEQKLGGGMPAGFGQAGFTRTVAVKHVTPFSAWRLSEPSMVQLLMLRIYLEVEKKFVKF